MTWVYTIGVILLIIVIIHLLVFITWWVMLPFMMIVEFMDALAGGRGTKNKDYWGLQCPFMKLFRKGK